MGLQGVSSAASVREPTTAARGCERIEAALVAFRGITDAVSGEADLESLLELVAERSSELLSVDRCAVYLLDEETGLYRGALLRARGADDDGIKRLTCGGEADRFTGEILRHPRSGRRSATRVATRARSAPRCAGSTSAPCSASR